MRNRKSIKIRFQQKQKAAAAAVIFAVNKTSRKAISDMNKSLSLSLSLSHFHSSLFCYILVRCSIVLIVNGFLYFFCCFCRDSMRDDCREGGDAEEGGRRQKQKIMKNFPFKKFHSRSLAALVWCFHEKLTTVNRNKDKKGSFIAPSQVFSSLTEMPRFALALSNNIFPHQIKH